MSLLVVTPTLGVRKSLQITLDSVDLVKRSSNIDIFHIVVSPELAVNDVRKNYPGADLYLSESSRSGIFGAVDQIYRSHGYKYKWLTFINDDDAWLPDYSILVDSINSNSDAHLLYAKSIFCDVNGKKIFDASYCSDGSNFHKYYSAGVIGFTQQSVIIKSDKYIELSGFNLDLKLCADSDLWVRFAMSGLKIKFINVFASSYTLQAGQLSSDFERKSKEDEYIKKYIKLSLGVKVFFWFKFRIFNSVGYIKRFVMRKYTVKGLVNDD